MDLSAIIKELDSEIAHLVTARDNLVGLNHSGAMINKLANVRASGGARNGTHAPQERRVQKPVSAATRKARALQGAYMGGLRSLSPTNRAKVKNMRSTSGVEAALKLLGNLRAEKASGKARPTAKAKRPAAAAPKAKATGAMKPKATAGAKAKRAATGTGAAAQPKANN